MTGDRLPLQVINTINGEESARRLIKPGMNHLSCIIKYMRDDLDEILSGMIGGEIGRECARTGSIEIRLIGH